MPSASPTTAPRWIRRRPTTGSAPPALPKLDDGDQAAAPAAAPAAPAAPEPPPEVAAGPEAVPQIEPPAGWTGFAVQTITAAVPSDFIAMDQDDEQATFFRGDMKSQTGLIFSISYEFPDNIVPGEAAISVDKEVSLDGQTLRWREFAADMDATHRMQAIVLSSPEPIKGRRHLLVAVAAIGVSLEDQRALVLQMLGTVRLGGAMNPNTAAEALDGLVGYEVPKDWHVMPGSDGRQISFWPVIYSGYVSFARGAAVTGPDGTDARIPAGTQAVPAEIFGQPADLYSWTIDDPEFQVGASMQPGRRDYYRLNGCTDGDAVSVMISGVPSFIDGAEFRAVLAGFKLNLPEGLETCPDGAALPGTAAPAPQPPQTATPEPAPPPAAAAAPAPPPAAAAAPMPPQAAGAAPAPRVHGTAVDVQGVTFILPEGWNVQNDSPDNKLFQSPDGRWTLLSFWWFPDEPLLGYTDITGVENLVVDHEPVMRITSWFEGFRTVQTVTERARADKKRFIFTVEGQSATEAEAAAMADTLTANLHLQGGFDASKRVDPLAAAAPVAAAPPAATPAPAPAPAPAGGIGETGGEVHFSAGLQGWTGDHATLKARPSGGPDGGGVLEAFTPGDGINGYLVAPPALLGDWTGAGGLRVTVKTGRGKYVGAYDYGGRGDIYLASDGKTASIAFPQQVGSDWTVEEMAFDAPGWKLGGGARSVAEVLGNLTDFHIRIEYLSGDATAWISLVELLPGSAAAPAPVVAPVAAGADAWAVYLNPRFGTRIDYPVGLFHALPPPDNGDGLSFATADGSARFLVFGQFNIDDLDARAMMARDRDWGNYDKVTYQSAGNGWYVLSGYSGSDIFYRKAVIDAAAGVVHVFEITYPQADRARFDPVVTRMAKSFGHQ